MTRWEMLADAVALFHAAYVAFVVFGFVAILIGALVGAQWVRNFWFRSLHFAAIGLVFIEAIVGVMCPLTTLEYRLRVLSGRPSHSGDFVAYWVHRLIFYDWPAWVFFALYAGFTALVGLLIFVLPPEPPRRGRARPRG